MKTIWPRQYLITTQVTLSARVECTWGKSPAVSNGDHVLGLSCHIRNPYPRPPLVLVMVFILYILNTVTEIYLILSYLTCLAAGTHKHHRTKLAHNGEIGLKYMIYRVIHNDWSTVFDWCLVYKAVCEPKWVAKRSGHFVIWLLK